MEDDGYLTHGLCPACFSIDFESADLSYEPRPVPDIVACCKIGCTFCGLLTFSLDLKRCMMNVEDDSSAFVSLSRDDEHSSPENQGCMTAALRSRIASPIVHPSRLATGKTARFGTGKTAWVVPGKTAWFVTSKTATFDITKLQGEYENSEGAILPLAPRITASEPGKPEFVLKRSFNWVKNQLDECTAAHICGGTTEMPLPTRVLDLGADETLNIRLLVPEEGAEGRYAALSYCWGRSNHFVLTSATIGDLKNGFNVCQLPQTLQDAVKVTRQIGLRYLWVDALCIIQGKDTEAVNDWNTEVVKMDTVYSNAFITISAASAQNASGGLFRGSYCDLPFPTSMVPTHQASINTSHWTYRSAIQQLSSRLARVATQPSPTRSTPRSLWQLNMFKSGSHSRSRSSRSAGDKEMDLGARVTWRTYSPDFKSEPINSRAWALQEDLLSTRVLFYASFGLLWKCNERITWGYSGETMVRSGTGRAQGKSDPDTDTPDFNGFNTSRYRVGRLGAASWSQNLELYTARNLTNPHDKLPAMSAIAQRHSHVMVSEYLAGLWKSNFRQELLWNHTPGFPLITVPDEGNPMRGDDYRAPTWSWAAVDGVVHNHLAGRTFKTLQYQSEVTLYPIPVLVDPRNPFGGIVKMSVQLQMRGPIENFHISEYPRNNRTVSIGSAEGRPGIGKLYLDDFSENALWRGREAESLLCLHILAFDDGNGQKSYALALLRIHEQKDTYIRIGMAEFLPSASPARHFGDMTIQTVTIL